MVGAMISIGRISRTAGIFNKEKLDWMNGVYLRGLSLDEYIKRLMPFLERDLPAEIARPLDRDYVKAWVPLIKERAKTLAEVKDLVLFFYEENITYNTADIMINNNQELTAGAFQQSLKLLESTPFTKEDLERVFRALAAQMELKPGLLFGPLRTAVTGRAVSPPLFEMMIVMGADKVKDRLRDALNKVTNLAK